MDKIGILRQLRAERRTLKDNMTETAGCRTFPNLPPSSSSSIFCCLSHYYEISDPVLQEKT